MGDVLILFFSLDVTSLVNILAVAVHENLITFVTKHRKKHALLNLETF